MELLVGVTTIEDVFALKVKFVMVVKTHPSLAPLPLMLIVLEPSVSVLVVLPDPFITSALTVCPFVSQVPAVRVMVASVPVQFIVSCNCQVPPAPLNVTFPVTFPPNVKAHVPDVLVKLSSDVVALPSVYVIPATSLNVSPEMVSVTEALWVRVFVYPVQSSEFTVMFADRVLLLAPVPTPSKITASDVPGTLALSCVLLAVPQLVGPVAFQFADDPPPTQ